jgi:DnaJ-class molecular chaperone
MKNPYKVLDIPENSSIDEVKKVFRNIALKSHPDKLNNIDDPVLKKKKIREFMEASNAYNSIINHTWKSNNPFDNEMDPEFDTDEYDVSYEDWIDTFNKFKESDLFKEMVNVFKKFTSRIIKHCIKADIKYSDYFNNNKKKLRLFLKNIEEPVYISLDCKKYPSHTINYFDNNDNEHEITINMVLINDPLQNDGYYHIDNDIHYSMDIDLLEWTIGGNRKHTFINGDVIDITIEPFTNTFTKKDYGIHNGNLIINFKTIPINKDKWLNLLDADKVEFIKILNLLKNDIKV